MDLQLKGKTAIVTGATAGIGLAIASMLAREGGEVTITGRTLDKLNAAAPKIPPATAGTRVRTIVANLANAPSSHRDIVF